ncbi:MAG: DUF2281 domain-containing protein [Acidobacteriota bacterium]|jgi:hypothetical protein|nr:DUF2281 domain-containing protein [Acidobacteriota bacterium]
MQNAGLIEKIQKLSAETRIEVEHFVEFLTEKQKAKQNGETDTESISFHQNNNEKTGSVNLFKRGISKQEAAAQRAALAAFAEDWERPEMEVYDKL